MVMHKCIPPYKRGQNLSETHLLPHLEIVEREREREGERERESALWPLHFSIHDVINNTQKVLRISKRPPFLCHGFPMP
jgi:hypothetical protein